MDDSCKQVLEQETTRRVVEALVSTGRIRHLAGFGSDNGFGSDVIVDTEASRQVPPTIAGTPVSEVLIAQRRGAL